MKGLFKGTKGLFLKPAIGLMDGIKSVTEGISKNVVTNVGRTATRVRDPRVFYGQERIFQEYNEREARVQKAILEKNVEKYAQLTNLASIFFECTTKNKMNQDVVYDLCLWLTAERIFLVDMDKGIIIWKLKSSRIYTFVVDNEGVTIFLNPSKKGESKSHIVSFFSIVPNPFSINAKSFAQILQ